MKEIKVKGGAIRMKGSRFYLVRDNGMTQKISRADLISIIDQTLSETSGD